jgi:UDP-glucose 4-epimerase
MPYVQQVAIGKRPYLAVYGNDWPTKDGTGDRDYLHVVDLAQAHVLSVKKLMDETVGCVPVNLGTGNPYSVLDMVKAMEHACGHKIEVKFVDRREGDIATLYTDPSFARKFLGWEAKLGVEEMAASAWKWQQSNPEGFNAA